MLHDELAILVDIKDELLNDVCEMVVKLRDLDVVDLSDLRTLARQATSISSHA